MDNKFLITPSDKDLEHYGILGMKWGVRRYQNPDGTLTALGRRRLNSGKSGERVRTDSDGYVHVDDIPKANSKIHSEVSDDYKSANAMAKGASEIAQRGKNIADQSANRDRQRAASKIKLDNMTDKELQAAVNRMNLERSYRTLSTEYVGAGKRHTGELLQTAGEVFAIGASAASILVALHTLKSK